MKVDNRAFVLFYITEKDQIDQSTYVNKPNKFYLFIHNVYYTYRFVCTGPNASLTAHNKIPIGRGILFISKDIREHSESLVARTYLD